MKRYSGILLLASLLLVISGCAFQLIEDPAAQDAESMYVATEPADIVGVWDHVFMGSHVPIVFTEDGELLYYLGSPPKVTITGNYWFEDGKLHFEEDFAGLGLVGVYSVLVQLENGEPVSLSLSAIDEPVASRQNDFERGLTRMEMPPAEAEAPTSYLATKPEDIVGAWEQVFMGTPELIRIDEDGTIYYYFGKPPKPQAVANYWFEDDKFHLTDVYQGPDRVGIYTIMVELENGEPARLVPVGIEDPVAQRMNEWELGLARGELPPEP
jgi:hypothetical protein